MHFGPRAILVALTLRFTPDTTLAALRDAIRELTEAMRLADQRIAYVREARANTCGSAARIVWLSTVRRHVPDDPDRLERDEPFGDEFVDRGKKCIHLVLRIDDFDQDRQIGGEFEELRRVDH